MTIVESRILRFRAAIRPLMQWVTVACMVLGAGTAVVTLHHVGHKTQGSRRSALILGAATGENGYAVSTYATSFPTESFPNDDFGPAGLAFDGAGDLFVADQNDNGIYKVPPGGSTGTGTLLHTYGGAVFGLALSKGGRLYGVLGSDVFEIDTQTGAPIRVVGTFLGYTGLGLATDPLSGDLFVVLESELSHPSVVGRVSNPDSSTPTTSIYAEPGLPHVDGDTFGADGTLYVADDGGISGPILEATGTNVSGSLPKGMSSIQSMSSADGLAVGSEGLAVVRNNGTVTLIDLSTFSTTDIVFNGDRGDLATVGPDGCLYASMGASVEKITHADGTCSFFLPPGLPLPTTLTTGLIGGTPSVLPNTPVTDSATLSGANTATAGGTVTYGVFSDSSCSTQVASGGTEFVTNGVAPRSASVSLTVPGTYYWQASYSGDIINKSSVSSCGSEIEYVQAPTSLTTSLAGGATAGPTISVLPNTPVDDAATLTGAEVGVAGGTATYDVYSDSACTVSVEGAGSVSVVNGSIPVSNSVTLATPGTYYWQATYGGDKLNQPSTSPCGSEIEYVQAPTTLATAIVGGVKSVAVGGAATDTATLAGEFVPVAGGSVTYTVYSDATCSTVAASGGTKSVVNGVAANSDPVTFAGPGTYYWQASYSGDKLNQPSESPCGSEILFVFSESDVSTVFTVETDPVYAGQQVQIDSAQLLNRCRLGVRWESNDTHSPFINSPAATAVLDNDGNASFVFKGQLCASGTSTVLADVLAGGHHTYVTHYTILPPHVVLHPGANIIVTANPASQVETGPSQVHAVVQVATNPALAGDPVSISSSQLQTSCQGGVTFETLQGGNVTHPVVHSNGTTVLIDNDGNATVVVDGRGCAPGKNLIEADVTVAPFFSATTTLVVQPPQTTKPGVAGSPANEVESGAVFLH